MLSWLAIGKAAWSLAKAGAAGLFAFFGTRTGRIVLTVAATAFVLWRVHEHGKEQGRAETLAECRAQDEADQKAAIDHVLEDIRRGAAISAETRDNLARDLASVDIDYELSLEVIRAAPNPAPPAGCPLGPDPVVVRELEAARARAGQAADRLRRKG